MIAFNRKVKNSDATTLFNTHNIRQSRKFTIGSQEDITNTQILRPDPESIQACFNVLMVQNEAVFVNNASRGTRQIRLISHHSKRVAVGGLNRLFFTVFVNNCEVVDMVT